MAKQSPRASSLSNIPIFSNLTKKDLTSIQRMMSKVQIEAGEEFITEGTVGRAAFIIVSGNASVWKGGKLVASVGPGAVIGEMALLAGTPCNATVKAETDLMVETLDSREFSAFLDVNIAVTRRVLKATIMRLALAEPSLLG
jgi:CRP-like cAMP-binding protein